MIGQSSDGPVELTGVSLVISELLVGSNPLVGLELLGPTLLEVSGGLVLSDEEASALELVDSTLENCIPELVALENIIPELVDSIVPEERIELVGSTIGGISLHTTHPV